MYHTKHYTGYEIWNYEVGTITFFESYDNVERWVADNHKDPKGYDNYGIKLVITNETELSYYWKD